MPRCLLVDDDADGRDGYQEYLENNGIDVAATDRAEAALGLARRQAFDLIIVDLQLPGMNGWDYMRAVRRDAALCAIPIICVSARVFPADRTRAADAGCDVFLAKPCTPDHLLSEVRRLLSGARTAS